MNKKNFGKLANEMLKSMPWHYASDILQDLNYLNDKGLLQKTGHWIIKGDKKQGYDICGVKTWYIETMCSKCGFINTAIEGHTAQYNYCPECGAKMESEAAEQ